MKNIIRPTVYAFALFSLFFLGSCSESPALEGDTKTALSVFIHNNENIVAFGNTHLKNILNKSDYKTVPKLGVLIDGELKALNPLIDLDAPIYYAMEGPIDNEGTPESIYAFLKVKSPDSLVTELTKRGFDVESKGDVHYCQDGDVTIGIKERIAVIVSRSGDYDGGKVVQDVFDKTSGDISGGKVDEIIASEGDVVFGVSLASLYRTTDTELEGLSDTKQQEIRDLISDSYIQTTFKFEDGAAIIESKNKFSKELMDRMFFNSDTQGAIRAKLGKGEPRLAVSINVDFEKMERFADDFSANGLDDLTGSMGAPIRLGMMAGGISKFSQAVTGEFGLAMFGEQYDDGSFTPDFSIFAGLKPDGVSLAKMGEDLITYSWDYIDIDNKGISAISNSIYESDGSKLKLPNGCENFGKSGISAFINLDGIDMDEFDLEGEQNLLRVVDYITVDYGNEGGRIYIKAKIGQENVLKQAMSTMIDEISAEIGGMSF